MINCSSSKFVDANGGDAPECYQWHHLPGDDTESTDCYHGVGVGYRGDVNITQSGRPCQSWKSQCPHRHLRIPKDVADSKNDSNMCRNPDSSAPDGPWCYTTDPNVRWEYCNVSRCTPRDRFIRDLMLVIILPLFIAAAFILAVCLKFQPICKSKQKKEEIELSKEVGDWAEIPRSDVTLQDKLGEGAFGEVYKGLVRVGGKERACAVKKLKANAAETERRDLLNELAVMVTVGEHPNVLSLIGACTRTESVLVIIRLAPNGCLLDQLKRNRENPYYDVSKKQINFTPQDKVEVARDVARGMLHLASKKCVHRDLAARNVLLDEENVAMVSDFGLSRDVYESGEYESTTGGMLPVRWMALESLEDYTYNTKTDVYDIMKSCWSLDPTKRPSFSELLESLGEERKTKGDFVEDKDCLEPEFKGRTNFSIDQSNDLDGETAI
ncbi:Tyrosine-protein kinase transmembrane receptor ROR2 [Stylophora pistillata]|uniref:receptor protein-tyrosine kinase n=1 Tax=Stylophora pistillata TaxID=50429 RepID=A0A2B4R6B4_STYPI|nr:Tyrosine-protein kinase transmembrane receptor ROR2 [Stylophora pistillata]